MFFSEHSVDHYCCYLCWNHVGWNLELPFTFELLRKRWFYSLLINSVRFWASARPDWQAEALCSQPVRPSVRLLPNLWTRCFENEWTDFGTSGPRVKAVKRATLGSGGQRSRSYGAEIGHKNHFGRNISRTSRQILTNPSSHSSLDDQRLKVEVTRGLAEASFGSSSVSSFYLFRSS